MATGTPSLCNAVATHQARRVSFAFAHHACGGSQKGLGSKPSAGSLGEALEVRLGGLTPALEAGDHGLLAHGVATCASCHAGPAARFDPCWRQGDLRRWLGVRSHLVRGSGLWPGDLGEQGGVVGKRCQEPFRSCRLLRVLTRGRTLPPALGTRRETPGHSAMPSRLPARNRKGFGNHFALRQPEAVTSSLPPEQPARRREGAPARCVP